MAQKQLVSISVWSEDEKHVIELLSQTVMHNTRLFVYVVTVSKRHTS